MAARRKPTADAEATGAVKLEDGATLVVRGEGGAVFPMDVPTTGTVKREIFDEHIRKGWLIVVSTDPDTYLADPPDDIVALPIEAPSAEAELDELDDEV